jgi:serine/threonine protein kinase
MNVHDSDPSGQRTVIRSPAPQGTAGTSLDDPRIVEALERYLAALESGDKPDRQTFLAQHPDVAEGLAECLDGMEALHRSTPSSQPAADAAGAFAPGTPLGDFRILREIGRGGMGVVYEAEQLSLGRRIALKVLPFALTLDARQLQRFKNEARAAAQLHHTNIVPIYSVGCERSVHFYAMQFIEGKTLAEVIGELRQLSRSGRRAPRPGRAGPGPRTLVDESNAPASPVADRVPAPGSEVGAQAGAGETAVEPVGALATAYSTNSPQYFRGVAQLGVQASEALEHAHTYGVVHRDIKPANLLVDVHGHLWITDFGLAQFQSDAALTQTGDLLGTLRYMSPEQALARRGLVDHRTDIYSLGATLYELLTLEPAYDGRDRQELLHQIAFEEPRPPRRWNGQIPADLETIILKAMGKGVEERYATARELAEDLRCFLELKPIRARRPTLIEKTAKWARRHRAVVASGVVCLLLAAVGFGVSTALIAQEQSETRQALHELAREKAKTEEALQGQERRAREAEKSYRQAREVVDFLMQVSVQEMAGPGLTDLRRRLLEAVLGYYEGFIRDRKDDPSSDDLQAARERVAGILGELSDMEGFGRVMFLTFLLGKRDVQNDLGLSEEQASEVRNLTRDRFRKPPPPGFVHFGQLNTEEKRQKLREMTRSAEEKLAFLKPEQMKRLKQIALQHRGVQGLTDPEVARQLGLTKKQLEDIREESHKALPGPPCDDGPPPDKAPKPKEAAPFADQRWLNVLDARQRALWKEMIGVEFKGQIWPAFGGPRGGRGPHHDHAKFGRGPDHRRRQP